MNETEKKNVMIMILNLTINYLRKTLLKKLCRGGVKDERRWYKLTKKKQTFLTKTNVCVK